MQLFGVLPTPSPYLTASYALSVYLQTLVLPPHVQAEVDLQSILVRAKPFSDAEDLLPVCYRCSTSNPLLNTQASGPRAAQGQVSGVRSSIAFVA